MYPVSLNNFAAPVSLPADTIRARDRPRIKTIAHRNGLAIHFLTSRQIFHDEDENRDAWQSRAGSAGGQHSLVSAELVQFAPLGHQLHGC